MAKGGRFFERLSKDRS